MLTTLANFILSTFYGAVVIYNIQYYQMSFLDYSRMEQITLQDY